MISFHSLQRCVVKPTAIATASSAFAAFRASFLGATTRATLDQIQINISRGENRDLRRGAHGAGTYNSGKGREQKRLCALKYVLSVLFKN